MIGNYYCTECNELCCGEDRFNHKCDPTTLAVYKQDVANERNRMADYESVTFHCNICGYSCNSFVATCPGCEKNRKPWPEPVNCGLCGKPTLIRGEGFLYCPSCQPESESKSTFSTGAQRSADPIPSRLALIPLEAIDAYGRAFAVGEAKYGRDNWLKGIPQTNLMEHAVRHCYRYLRGNKSEDDLGHAFWNLGTAIFQDINRPDMDDRPKYHLYVPGEQP